MEILNDRHEIWATYSSSCIFCKNGFDMINFTCKAFPEEIPDEILSGKDLHHVPFKGQKNKIVFKPQSRYLKMKTLIPVLLIMLLFISCEKENKILFDIPLTDWSLTKSQVIAVEDRTLLSNTEPSEIIYLVGPFNTKGDGSLKYSDNGYFEEVNYGFYSSGKTLEETLCLYAKTNSKPTDQALKYLSTLYGDYTTRSKPVDYSGFSGKIYKFTADFGIVVLEEYSQTTNRITFTKAQYSSYY